METKLELRHIAPYLPWGLIMAEIIPRFDAENKIEVLHYDRGELLSYLGTVEPYIVWQCTRQHSRQSSIRETSFDKVGVDVKPIMRPLSLSNLTKDLEIDDEVQSAMERLHTIHPFKESYLDMATHISEMLKTESLPQWILFKLFEWNFDVFQLIESGLAIDINSIKP